MNAVEGILLIVGAIIFVASFILPEKKRGLQQDTKKMVEEAVSRQVEKEMEQAKIKIDDIVEETISYTIDKTERSMERISNEKIMAVNEYSDTVLDEIHKNHEEVVFLYDMLNNKQKNIKKTVSDVEKSVKEAKEKMENSQELVQTNEKAQEKKSTEIKEDAKELKPFPVKKETEETTPKRGRKKKVTADTIDELPEVDLSFIEGTKGKGRNNNERILTLHQEGKSNVAIAKELGLGVGEVKLVIDLFKGMA